MTVCKHCGDPCPTESIVCEACGGVFSLMRQCRVCHDEVKHDLIRNQNIHIVGGVGKITDEDANGGWSQVTKAFEDEG